MRTQLHTRPLSGRGARAFTMVEAVVALGIIAFSLVAVVNVLPAGLESQKQAVDQAFGTQTLARVAESLRGVYRDKNGSLEFLAPMQDLKVAAGESKFYYVLSDGALAAGSGTPPRGARARLRVEQSVVTADRLISAQISIAWPAQAAYSGGKWTKADGSTSTFLYINLPQ